MANPRSHLPSHLEDSFVVTSIHQFQVIPCKQNVCVQYSRPLSAVVSHRQPSILVTNRYFNMVFTDGQSCTHSGNRCYACQHALIAAERAMKASNTTSSSEENYGALPSSYRRLRKSKSMHAPFTTDGNPFLKLKRSLSKLSPQRPRKAD